jgi:transposase
MPGERLSMRKIREVMRLRFAQGLSQRAVGRSLGLSIGALNGYLSRARMAGLTWPLPETLDDGQLEALLYPPPPDVAPDRRPVPDWAVIHSEMRRPNVTLALLWEEYRASSGGSDGFGYSWFCDLYREWVGRLKPTLRQVHTAGERVFVDFAGQAMEVIDGATGEVRRAEIFVGVLGASSYTFAEAIWTQSLPDWIAVHVNMLTFIGGVPQQIVSDNLRAGITRACFYEPLVHRTYADMASYYGTAVVPARPYKPRDKAKVEVGGGGAALDPGKATQPAVLLAGRTEPSHPRIDRSAQRPSDAGLGNHPARALRADRSAVAAGTADHPVCVCRVEALPGVATQGSACVARGIVAQGNLDYHIEIEKHFYSVPFRLLREEVEARITGKTVKIFHRGKLVATHLRSLRQHRLTTTAEHMPSSHRRYRDWIHERIVREAAGIGDEPVRNSVCGA